MIYRNAHIPSRSTDCSVPYPLNRAVFLDRDGVLNATIMRNGQPTAPFLLDELQIVPGVPEALTALRAAGFQLIVVTNQPDVVRGHAVKADVEAINASMLARLPLDEIRVCYHDTGDGCACRKPKPGMLIAAAVEREIELARSFLVGDRWRDIGAGKAAGCTTILVNAFPGETKAEADVEFPDLSAAVDWITARR
jgi:D-glycero-D-manno-heptose 1,7-bisphosphate phosphatase